MFTNVSIVSIVSICQAFFGPNWVQGIFREEPMINKFEKQLEKWNGGVLRGAQAKLARLLQVSTATVALWATGKRRPSKGYVAQMAQLFGLDEFYIMRLFTPATTYPEVNPLSPLPALRDAQTPENTYTADNSTTQSNSVSVPLLSAVPLHYPALTGCEVTEWWTLPRQRAQGGKYLLELDNALWLIKPTHEFLDGKKMLISAEGSFLVVQVQGLTLLQGNGQTFPTDQARAHGLAVLKISYIV